ncbi:MAG: hypothetical protein AAGN82_28945 [Myxococcota bacterium]
MHRALGSPSASGWFVLLWALLGSGPGCRCDGGGEDAALAPPPEAPAEVTSNASAAASASTRTGGGRTLSRQKVRPGVPRFCRAACWVSGQCGAEGKACVAVSEEDCRASYGCRVNGLCTWEGKGCFGKSDQDCRASERCRTEGLCAYVGVGTTNCRPATDDHCAESEACARYGRCRIGADGYCDDPDHPRPTPSASSVAPSR